MMGKVYLVGAGPGDPGLITIKGLKCIKKADVLVYDRLVSRRLLDYAKPACKLIYAGKDPDKHAVDQKLINDTLIDYARQGLTVIRLKGGDPFVFGRGGEEAAVLALGEVPFEIVPGVTSAAAVPAYAGIPLTYRNKNSSLAIITGNEDPEKASSQIPWAQLTNIGTLVVLMGLKNLPHIVSKLLAEGMKGSVPAAVIQWGTTPEQKTVTGTLDTISDLVIEHELKHPAVIVIGETGTLREQLMWAESRPLFGKRVLITRPKHQADKFADQIEELGGEPLVFPVIDIVAPEDFAPLDAALEEIKDYHWIIFTSANGVNIFFDRLYQLKKDVRSLTGVKIAAIGPKTCRAIEKRGLLVDYMPQEYVAEAVIEGMQELGVAGKKILLPRADIAREVLPMQLTNVGARVTEVVAYQTVAATRDSAYLLELLEQKKIHVVTFTSSSTVRNFVRLIPKDKFKELLSDVTVACIGPITADTARYFELEVDIEAEEYTLEGLISKLVEFISNTQ